MIKKLLLKVKVFIGFLLFLSGAHTGAHRGTKVGETGHEPDGPDSQ